MDSSSQKLKVTKSSIGWTPLVNSKISPSSLGDSHRNYISLVGSCFSLWTNLWSNYLGEGMLLSTYKQPSPLGNYILSDINTKTVLHMNKTKVREFNDY
jgi:hypothetical protein